MKKKMSEILIFLVIAILFSSCGSNNSTGTDEMDDLYQALAKQEVNTVSDLKDKAKEELSECEYKYLDVIFDVQKILEEIETLANVADIGNTASSLIKQGYDLMPYVRNYLDPYVEMFKKLREDALYAYENSCTFYTPYGVNFSLKTPIKYASFSVSLGYEWDEEEARAFYALSEFVLSVFDFIYSHSLELDVYSFPDIGGENGVEMLRSIGALMAWNSELLDFSDSADMRVKFDGIAQRWLDGFRAINDSGEERDSVDDDKGIMSFLFSDFNKDPDPNDDVLSIIDTVPLNKFSPGDKIRIGIKSVELGEVISIPEMDGIVITLNADLAQIFDTLYESGSALLWKIEQSLASVYDDKIENQFITMSDINNVLESFSSVVSVPVLPEIAKIDLKAFFRGPAPDYSDGPKPLRDYLPYWYDDDGDIRTDEVFMVEGESFIEYSPYVYNGDWEHFPTSIQWEQGSVSTKIEKDEIGPDAGNPLLDGIIYYLGLQDPSFNGMLYLDLTKLPYAHEPSGEMSFADLYTFNKLSAWLQVGAPGLEFKGIGIPVSFP